MYVAKRVFVTRIKSSSWLALLLVSPELAYAAENSGSVFYGSLDVFLHGLANFLLPAITVTFGILLLTILVWAYRGAVGDGALGIVAIAERLLGLARLHKRGESVSVEYRDLDGRRLDLGPFIHAVARHSRGGPAPLLGGAFVKCNPTWFTPGALIDVNVQENLVREDLVVQWDYGRNILFVQSQYSFATLVAKIHRRP